MKKFLILGSTAVCLFILSGCSFLYQDASESSQSDAVIDVSQTEEPWQTAEFEAVNQYGDTVSIESLEGEWWISKTIFTRCPTVCMTMTPNMVELQSALEEKGVDIRIVSFTVDPDFDTPERLEEYGESYGADFNNWDFLTGYEFEDIQQFALESFKSQIQQVPEESDIMHPTRFFLVNPDGIVHRMYSGEKSFDLKATVEDITEITGS
ncbi:SCO family protein [Salipaludibacillus sp. CF4.18]|uniref:SCO family protein n=1 Tax=Salipaludibacillus sp. CF4.18 TaxID=3373081 RepID=UPI003EE7C351